jgi:putative membrane protein
MKRSIRCAALLAGVGLAATAASADAQIPVEKDRGMQVQTTSAMSGVTTPSPTRVVEVSTGDLELYRGATDANVVAHILTGDSLEIAMSRLALARSSNATVREFAQMMVEHHSRNEAEFRAMQADEDIGIMPMANDPIAAQGRNALANLENLTGAAFDRAYLRAQVMHHDADAAALAQMADMARDDDLEQDIEEKLLPVVRQHLARARDIAGQLGVDVSSYRMTP